MRDISLHEEYVQLGDNDNAEDELDVRWLAPEVRPLFFLFCSRPSEMLSNKSTTRVNTGAPLMSSTAVI